MNIKLWPWLALTFSALEIATSAQSNSGFQISGTIVCPTDGCNQAVVVLCDAPSGEPVCRRNAQPFTLWLTNDVVGMDWLTVIPDAAGHFQFTNLPAGNYIVVAQAWNSSLARTNLINFSREYQLQAREFRAETLHLLGRMEVAVPSALARAVALTPPGTNSVPFVYQHDGEMLLLGTQPQRGDPVLKWQGWGTNFIRHLIGLSDIPRGGMLVHGLPATAYAAIFANDNSPGFGYARLNFDATNAVKIPVVAGWSDGYKTPPTNLVWLVELLATNRFNIDKALGITNPPPPRLSYWEKEQFIARLLVSNWNREVILPTSQKTCVADLLTALGYARLNRKINY